MRIMVVDDHAPTRQEMISLLSREDGFQVVGESESGEDAVEKAGVLKPEVIIMDLALPGMTGVQATGIIMEGLPLAKIIALSNHSGRNLVHAVLKTPVHHDDCFFPAARDVPAFEQ